MIGYNLKAAIRNILRFRSHTIISLLGLVLGLACVFVISGWTIQELMFDKFHEQSETIYMVTTDIKDNDGDFNSFPETPPPLASDLENQIPDVEAAFHFVYLYGGRPIKTDHYSFKETGIAADSKFLDILNFKLTIGNPLSLDEPNSILLCESLAMKLFPNEDPVGKTLVYGKDTELIVRGILKEVPENSSLQFDYLISYQIESDNPDEWWQLSDATFIKIKPGTEINEIKQLSKTIWRQKITDDQYHINFIPIEDLRYKAKFSFFNTEHGSSQKLYTFIFVATLILVLACLNYVNLISAYATKRSNEVAIRKINGANTRTLLGYFLSESIVMSLIAWFLAAVLAKLLLQFLESILDINIVMYYLDISLLVGFFITLIGVGVISGLYPAIASSSISPFNIRQLSSSNFRFQKKLKGAFVLSQFVLSISLTIVCLVIIRQTNYMVDFKVGFETDQVVQIYLSTEDAKDFRAVKDKMLSYPEIDEISFAGATPINLPPIFTTGNWEWEGLNEGTHTSIYRLNVDEDYIKVFQIPLVEGRFFMPSENETNKVVINEQLKSLIGFGHPIGRIIKQGEQEFEIIGVTKDFHFQHLSNRIEPLLFKYSPTKTNMFVKTNGQPGEALKLLQSQHKKMGHGPLAYSYLSDKHDELYQNEREISVAILAFTGLAILLSSIGLIGLIIFNTEMKTREIAVRKVHGASISQIAYLLNTGIILWFTIGCILSCLIVRYAMNKWLEGFAYKIPLDWWLFVLGAVIILLFTVMTISLKTWKAAIKKPIEALKYE